MGKDMHLSFGQSEVELTLLINCFQKTTSTAAVSFV